MPDLHDNDDPSARRLPPGVPATSPGSVDDGGEAGVSRPAEAYPTVATVERPPTAHAHGDDDEWRWDDGRYVRITPPPSGPRLVLFTFLGIAVLLGVLIVGALAWVRGQMDPPGDPGNAVVLNIPSGSSTDSIATLLAEEGVVQNPTVFRYYLRWQGVGDFQAGSYRLAENMSFDEAIEVLEGGPAPVQLARFTVPEGLTVAQMGEHLEDQIEGFTSEEMASALIRMESDWRPRDIESWEGLLFPDTYEFDVTEEPAEILGRLKRQFDAVATEVGLVPYMNLDPATGAPVGITAYQHIVIASMIEEESRVPEEYAKVSRVIHNRLAIGMPLGIDATVLYARGPERTGPLTDADLDIDSPYNTRKFPGLPPTPIAAPGRAALAAALNPEPGDWLYYVLAGEDGTHFFTDDYDEFVAQRDESRARGLF